MIPVTKVKACDSIVVHAATSSSSPSDVPIKAVVLLFGWLGAEQKHLHKYAEFFQRRHCSTVMTAAPFSAIMLGNTKALRAVTMGAVREASKLIRLAEHSNKTKVPVVIQAFSNGGGFVVEHLDMLLQHNKSNTQHKKKDTKLFENQEEMDQMNLLTDRLSHNGCEIYDSCPAYLHLSAGMRAIQASSPNKVIGIFASYAWACFLPFLGMWEILLGRVSRREAYWNNMLHCNLTSLQAFIYSEADQLTDHVKLDEFVMMKQKQKQTNGRMTFW